MLDIPSYQKLGFDNSVRLCPKNSLKMRRPVEFEKSSTMVNIISATEAWLIGNVSSVLDKAFIEVISS